MTTTMGPTGTTDTLRSTLLVDFATASVEVSKARSRQRDKDSPAHRDAVTVALGRVDALLDMYLAARVRLRRDPW